MAENQPDISLIPAEQKKQGFSKASSFRRPEQPAGGSFKLLATLLIVFIVASGGLFFWAQSLAGEEEVLMVELQSIRAEQDAAIEGEVAEINEILSAFEFALANHRLWSELFETIEERIVEDVTLTTLTGDYQTGTLMIDGLASSYNLLAQQVKSLESEEGVIRVDVPTVRVAETGLVEFTMTVIVKKSAIK